MKKNLTYLFVFIYFLPTLSAQDCTSKRYKQRVFDNINITTDLVYGQADPYDVFDLPIMEDLALDFYEPVNDNLTKRPLVISCYGGAFLFGTKEDSDVQAWCDSLTQRGYACAAINYRLGLNPASERSAYRAVYRAVQDLRAAIRYLLEDPNNLGFNVDPDNIFVEGQSAGAITAIHAAFLTASERPIETLPSTSIDEGSDLGCLDCSGNSFVQPVNIKGILSMWGAVESLDFIDANENTPMLMVHGDSDPIVPFNTGRPFNSPFFPEVNGSNIMAPWLTNLGIYNEFYPYENDNSHTVYGEPIAMTFPQDSWFDIFESSQQFLYKLIRFDNPLPIGNTTVNLNESHTYSIVADPNSTYCWTVEGGTITANNGANITVLWNNDIGVGTVSVQEENYFALCGEANPLMVNINSSLPIVWTSFTVQQQKSDIHLNWQVESEVNFSHYNVEKSKDGTSFSTILKQEKKETSTGKSSYQLIDHQPFMGSNYYRLKAVDMDGKFSYSEVIAIDIATFFELKVWMDSDLRLSFYSQDEMENLVQILDMQGRLVFEQTLVSIEGQNEWNLPFFETRSEIYFLKIRNSYGEKVRKFLVR